MPVPFIALPLFPNPARWPCWPCVFLELAAGVKNPDSQMPKAEILMGYSTRVKNSVLLNLPAADLSDGEQNKFL
jgi:hypothetical protein